jgi:hypothetical protein
LTLATLDAPSVPVAIPSLFPSGSAVYPKTDFPAPTAAPAKRDPTGTLHWVFSPPGWGPSGLPLPASSSEDDYAQRELLGFSLVIDRAGRVVSLLPLRRGDQIISGRLAAALRQLPYPAAEPDDPPLRTVKAFPQPMTSSLAKAHLMRYALLRSPIGPALAATSNNGNLPPIMQDNQRMASGQFIWHSLRLLTKENRFQLPLPSLVPALFRQGSIRDTGSPPWSVAWPANP